ncbi:MAG: hypothetical protein O7F12_00390 [Nitrospirae bacterium]|nr:hypothetical protein [Nitrospirota bacterium]
MTKPRLLLSIVVGLALMLATPVLAGFQAGVEAYKRGDYETALKELRPLADQGDAVAQYNLGLMYGKGQGVAQDYVLAHMWVTLAALRGKEDALKVRGILEGLMTPAFTGVDLPLD